MHLSNYAVRFVEIFIICVKLFIIKEVDGYAQDTS